MTLQKFVVLAANQAVSPKPVKIRGPTTEATVGRNGPFTADDRPQIMRKILSEKRELHAAWQRYLLQPM